MRCGVQGPLLFLFLRKRLCYVSWSQNNRKQTFIGESAPQMLDIIGDFKQFPDVLGWVPSVLCRRVQEKNVAMWASEDWTF